jgi:hypothetical protein
MASTNTNMRPAIQALVLITLLFFMIISLIIVRD